MKPATTTADQVLESGKGVGLGQIEPPANSGATDVVPPGPKVQEPTTTPNHP